ncbi:hypothetical protein GW933_00340 [Candidatus Falkowbacteria bacterium]|uniref:Uncharacterized protein n=1 Tax=Candidatus Buchananbacteria bacterium CG10_big_fil_rev_8_21_14_0_10_33_19 TaxID=1974525 RepID=A0A2H0W358_9BACT|nr:hypothetical protein [Candidatus Falkowbacteria bacterium]PIS05707.1 MAG: hypothetical protein COT80_02965 [Candidatus Buchananbacteria bacterium CG10_big_fil_rev_8_21_14_0_10_33_19]
MEEEFNSLDKNSVNNKSSIEDLLRENIRYNRAIFSDMQKIKRHMMWRTIFNVIWLILFVAPLIVAAIWLPSFISDFTAQFQGFTGNSSNTIDLLQQLQQLK